MTHATDHPDTIRRIRRLRLRLMFAGWRTFLTLAGLLLAVIAGFAWGVAARLAYREALLAEPVQTVATVQSRRIEKLEIIEFHHGNGQVKRACYLTYAFTPDGGDRLVPEVKVSPGVYAGFAPGDPIPIEYARDDSRVNRPLACRRSHRVAMACIGPGGVSIVAAFLLGLAWKRTGLEVGSGAEV